MSWATPAVDACNLFHFVLTLIGALIGSPLASGAKVCPLHKEQGCENLHCRYVQRGPSLALKRWHIQNFWPGKTGAPNIGMGCCQGKYTLVGCQGIGLVCGYHSDKNYMPRVFLPSLQNTNCRGLGSALTNVGLSFGLPVSGRLNHTVPMPVLQNQDNT